MTTTLRAELDRIEAFLMGPEGRDLAAILSALRGPDVDAWGAGISLKRRTTTFVRSAAFPRLKTYQETDGAFSYDYGATAASRWDFTTATYTFDNRDEHCGRHFHRHIAEAADVLGLKEETE